MASVPPPSRGAQGRGGAPSGGAPGGPSGGRGGIPDGAIVGLLAFLLGTTALFWASTALGGLISHGALPHPLPFTSTAGAIRHLATAPNDLPGAWPTTARATLPSPLAFWLTFFALLALILAVLLTLATARARHRATLATAAGGPQTPAQRRPEPSAASTPAAAPVGGGTRLRKASGTVAPDSRVPSDAGGPYAGADGRPPQVSASAGVPPWALQEGLSTAATGTVPPAPRPAAFPVAPPVVAGPAEGRTYLPGQSVPGSVRRGMPPVAPLPTMPPMPARPPAPPARFVLPEGTTCVLAPEATAASRLALLGEVIAEAKADPLLVVGADPALWGQRPPYRRAARFDPQQLTGEDQEQPRGRWAPHSGCEDTVVATARAHALLLPTARPAADAEEQGVRDLAETLLRCWLHAAALDGRPFRHVARWASAGGGAVRQEAVAILNTTDAHRSGEGWGGLLQAALLRPAPALDAGLARVRASLGALAELHILTACTPASPSTALDPGALLRTGEANSLYVLGHAGDARLREPGDTAPPAHAAMPLLTALVDDVYERARRTAVRSSAGRLDPALTFVLDDIAAVAPFPGLPDLMARGGPLGLRAVALLRSPEQARARWGDRAVHSLWTSADHRAVLGPLAPAPLGALLAAVGSLGDSPQGGLDRDELLLLPGRGTGRAQRFRITAQAG